MKIAVTGCNGFVGTRIVLAALAQGHVVHGIDTVPCSEPLAGLLLHEPKDDDQPHFKFQRIDLLDFDATLAALEGADTVVQLAGVRTPTDYKVVTHNTYVSSSRRRIGAPTLTGACVAETS